MKKKYIFKIIVTLFFAVVAIYSIICVIKCFSKIVNLKDNAILMGEGYYQDNTFSQHIKYLLRYKTYELIFFLVCAFSNGFCLLILNLKDLQFLTESILEKTKKYREKKKKEKLEMDIAKKQAMLEEMKKDGE